MRENEMELGQIRGRVDAIDAEIARLFDERMDLCGRAAACKLRDGLPVYDGARAREKLEKLENLGSDAFVRKGLRELFSQIMTIGRRCQYRRFSQKGKRLDLGFHMVEELKLDGARVVYQGVEGAYQHAAALKVFGDRAGLYHVAAMEEAMVEVEEGRADYAVLPIENSSAGAVSDNYDSLVRHSVYIVAETRLPVCHALLGLPGASLENIRQVYSHPQALMQCAPYLNAHRRWRQVSVENTAGAAKKVLEDGDPGQAAVASEIAGRLYGLKVLEPSINYNKDNTTRFIVLAREPIYRRGAGKISICFEGAHKSGSLYNMLSNLIYNDLNMLMIESRPIEGRSWEYRFFVDLEGSLGDAAVENALRGIREEAARLRILGNY